MLQQLEQLLQPLGDRVEIEHRLFGLQLERQMGRDRVGQTARIIDAGDRRQNFRRNLLVELDVLVELLRHRAAQRLDFGRGLASRLDRRHLGDEVFAGVSDVARFGALQSLDQDLHGAIGQLEHLQNARDAANAKHVFGARLVLASGLLSHQHDLAAGFHRRFERLDRFRPPDEQRDDHVREHDHVAQREQRQRDRVGRKNGVSRHWDLSFSGRHEA